jgi:hypothetical protein
MTLSRRHVVARRTRKRVDARVAFFLLYFGIAPARGLFQRGLLAFEVALEPGALIAPLAESRLCR